MVVTRYLPVIAFIFFTALMARALYLNPNHVPSNLIDKQVPKFNLQDMQGNAIDEKIFKQGKYLAVFWATWCSSCLSEHSALNMISEQNKDIKLIGFNYKDSISSSSRFLKMAGSPYQYNLIDESGASSLKWGIRGTPESFLIVDGIIKCRHSGPMTIEIFENLKSSFS